MSVLSLLLHRTAVTLLWSWECALSWRQGIECTLFLEICYPRQPQQKSIDQWQEIVLGFAHRTESTPPFRQRTHRRLLLQEVGARETRYWNHWGNNRSLWVLHSPCFVVFSWSSERATSPASLWSRTLVSCHPIGLFHCSSFQTPTVI
jgi:hypothetical protein